MRGFKLKQQYVSEDEYLTFEEASRLVVAAAPEWRAFAVPKILT